MRTRKNEKTFVSDMTAQSLEDFIMNTREHERGSSYSYTPKGIRENTCGYIAIYEKWDWQEILDLLQMPEQPMNEEEFFEAFDLCTEDYRISSSG